MHERGDGGHQDQHHRGERVDADRPGDVEVARGHPGEQLDRAFLPAERRLEEDDPGEEGGDEQQAGGDELGGARADQPAEQAGDEEADEGRKTIA